MPSAFAPCFADPFAVPLGLCPSFSEGGVKSPAPPGYARDVGATNDLACCAVDGWEIRLSLSVSMIEVLENYLSVPCQTQVKVR